MKKVFAFLRSMTFGMLLLILIAVCSVAGSLIPQQREAMEYVSRYGSTAAQWILRLGLDDVFSTPYFTLLMAALCLNLTLCSVIRVAKLRGAGDRLQKSAAAIPAQ
ncbi:MAG: cytochrome c biogenesis protein ResB, partial [Clostridia bacterium]|nr:cytochrome c biogenesis protein ResB [Clostridia bacterium]